MLSPEIAHIIENQDVPLRDVLKGRLVLKASIVGLIPVNE